MAKTRFILVRVDQTQFERIKNNVSAKGYTTMSAYIRDLALGKNLVFERQFNEVYRGINEIREEVISIAKKLKKSPI